MKARELVGKSVCFSMIVSGVDRDTTRNIVTVAVSGVAIECQTSGDIIIGTARLNSETELETWKITNSPETTIVAWLDIKQ